MSGGSDFFNLKINDGVFVLVGHAEAPGEGLSYTGLSTRRRYVSTSQLYIQIQVRRTGPSTFGMC